MSNAPGSGLPGGKAPGRGRRARGRWQQRTRGETNVIPTTYGHVGVPLEFTGNAYDFGHRIAAVEFSLDDGEHWTRYETAGTNDYQNVTWTFTWTPEQAGSYELRVRSVNDEGRHSPEAAAAQIRVD